MSIKQLIGMFDDRSIREALQGTFGVVTTADGVIIHLWFLEITFGSTSISVKKKGATSNIFAFNYNSTKVAKAGSADTATLATNTNGQCNASSATLWTAFKIATSKSTNANGYMQVTMLVSDELQGNSKHATYLATLAVRGTAITGHIKLLDKTSDYTDSYLDLGIVKTGTNYNTEWYIKPESAKAYRKITTTLLNSDHLAGTNRFTVVSPAGTTTTPTYDVVITHT